MILEVKIVGNQKSSVVDEDFAWQQALFHVKAMEISRLPGIGMHDVGGIRNAPGK